MRRGDVWWARLPGPAGRTPVVLVSRDSAYAIRSMVTVAPVSTQVRGIPVEVPLGRPEGLTRAGAANTDSILTIPKQDLERQVGVLGTDKLRALDAALAFSLGLDARS